MAVAWPATLPAPLRAGLTVTPNPDVKARITQSGRKELRRWGKGGGDTLTCTLRLWNNHPAHGDQVAKFKRYWSRDLNMGLNWIDADWLETGLGYSACYLRIIGYSQRRAVGTLYSDYAVSFVVRTMAAVWTDTEWPSGSTVEGPYDFSAAAVWVVADLPYSGCSLKLTTTPRWPARNLTAAQLKVTASGTSSNGFSYPTVCKTATPPYVEIKRVSSTSHNNYSTTITYDTASVSPVTDIGDKAIHMYVTAPLYTEASYYAGCAFAGSRALGVLIYGDRFDFRLFDNSPSASIPRTSLQVHGGISNLFIISILYRHADQAVKAFVEGFEVYSGTTPYAMGTANGPIFNGQYHLLHGVIVENTFDERSVQAAINFFSTL